jgi:hypothetical protein
MQALICDALGIFVVASMKKQPKLRFCQNALVQDKKKGS